MLWAEKQPEDSPGGQRKCAELQVEKRAGLKLSGQELRAAQRDAERASNVNLSSAAGWTPAFWL